jgi:hypothetical protein
MEATVLLCNWCRAKGKAEFASTHAEITLRGAKVKTAALDACDKHARRFYRALLVGTRVNGKTPKQPGVKAGTTLHAKRARISDEAREDVKLRALKLLAEATKPMKGPGIYAVMNAGERQNKLAMHALREQGLVLMTGTKSAARYTITTNGKRSLGARRSKEKAPAAAATSAPAEKRAARRLRGKRRQRHRR